MRPQLREAGRQRARPRRRVVAHRRLEEEWWIERQPQVGAGALHVLRDAVGAAEHPALTLPQREAEPRLETFLVGVVKRTIVIRREDLLACLQIEVPLTIVLLIDRLRVRPPHAEVECQRRRDLEVVLNEERAAIVQVRPRGRQAAAAFARHLVEKEIGERKIRERGAVAEYAEQTVVAGVEAALHVMQQLPAELHCLAARDPCELFVDLIRPVERVAVARSGAER